MITTGIELTTAITNIAIFFVSIYSFFKTKDKLWKIFFFLMSVDSFLGTIAHGIVMSQTINNILWVILTIIFTITINMFICIFKDVNMKTNYLLSIILSITLLILFYLGLDYLLVFSLYCLLVVLFSIYLIIKKNYKNKLWFLLGLFFQLLGGVFIFTKTDFGLINHNCIYHLLTVITVILFYIGNKKVQIK